MESNCGSGSCSSRRDSPDSGCVQATALAGKITEANKQVEANKKAAEQAQDRAEDAGKVASGNERALKKRIAEIKHELDQARNKSPECDELLTTSVKKVCGL